MKAKDKVKKEIICGCGRCVGGNIILLSRKREDLAHLTHSVDIVECDYCGYSYKLEQNMVNSCVEVGTQTTSNVQATIISSGDKNKQIKETI